MKNKHYETIFLGICNKKQMFIVQMCHVVDGYMQYKESSVIEIYDDVTKQRMIYIKN